MITLKESLAIMITLKESLLDKTSRKIKNMPDTIKRAQLEVYGFPKFEDNDEGAWVWNCPEYFSEISSELNKVLGTNHNYTGVYVMNDEGFDADNIDEQTVIHIKLLTDKYTAGWPNERNGESVSLINIRLPYKESMGGGWSNKVFQQALKDIYDLFLRFALNVVDMVKDMVKAKKTSDYAEYGLADIYDNLIK